MRNALIPPRFGGFVPLTHYLAIAGIVAALALVAAPGPAPAQWGEGGGQRRGGMGQGMGWRWGEPLDYSDLLELTVDQREQLDAIAQETREKVTELQTRTRAARESLQTLMADDQCDPTQVLAVSHQINGLERELESIKISRIMRQRSILTEEQLRTLRRTLADRPPMRDDDGGWQRGERWGGGGMGWRRDGGSDGEPIRSDAELWEALLDALEDELPTPTPEPTPTPQPTP